MCAPMFNLLSSKGTHFHRYRQDKESELALNKLHLGVGKIMQPFNMFVFAWVSMGLKTHYNDCRVFNMFF